MKNWLRYGHSIVGLKSEHKKGKVQSHMQSTIILCSIFFISFFEQASSLSSHFSGSFFFSVLAPAFPIILLFLSILIMFHSKTSLE